MIMVVITLSELTEECPIKEFEKNNLELINSSVFKSFRSSKENLEVYEKAICEPNEKTLKKLEQSFKEHYFKLRFTSYLATSIHYNAVNFDKKERKIKNRNQLILNQMNKDESNLSLMELVPDNSRVNQPEEAFEDGLDRIEEIMSDELLVEAISLLTNNQKEIIKLAYINGLKDTEIGEILNKSQQAVSKSHRKALEILRKNYELLQN
jgi:RNA polymerase sigma factor (sigma-70 family)